MSSVISGLMFYYGWLISVCRLCVPTVRSLFCCVRLHFWSYNFCRGFHLKCFLIDAEFIILASFSWSKTISRMSRAIFLLFSCHLMCYACAVLLFLFKCRFLWLNAFVLSYWWMAVFVRTTVLQRSLLQCPGRLLNRVLQKRCRG